MMFTSTELLKCPVLWPKVTFCIACWAVFHFHSEKLCPHLGHLLLLSLVGIWVGLRQKTLFAFGLASISLITFLLRLLLSFLKIIDTLGESDLFNVQFQILEMSAYSESLLESECDRHLK